MRAGFHIAILAVLAFGAAGAAAAGPASEPAPLPQRLAETGLYVDGPTTGVRPEHLPFSPQYPLWSDGAGKRRWLSLPAGTAIDAADADAWVFPVGTRLWKEFSHGDRRVETRYIERLGDGSWRYATYVWNAEQTDAVLAPEFGATVAVPEAPGGRYAVPSRGDCLACHDGARAPVLGLGALQLSPDRDPLAPHAEPGLPGAIDLRVLVERGLLRNLPRALLATPPRVGAATPVERAALGYLHGNCGHCHDRSGVETGVPVEVPLAQPAATTAAAAKARVAALLDRARYRPHGWSGDARLLVPGDPAASVLAHRMRSRNPMTQMPPLGTRLADAEGLALIERWIGELQPHRGPYR